MIHQCTKFQELSVSKWNPHAGKVTKSAFMGLVCVDESDSKGCGAITLDLLLKAGIINTQEDGSWALASDWETRRPIIFGDAKTTENMSKFMRDMQIRELSLSEESIQFDVRSEERV